MSDDLDFARSIVHDALSYMHEQMAYRDNASSSIIKAMAQLGKPFNDSLAAGLLSIGNVHAPIKQACRLWNNEHWFTEMSMMYLDERRIPGFGSAWYKEEPDPVVEQFFNSVPAEYGKQLEQMHEMVEQIKIITDRSLYPNAALATALACDCLKFSPEIGIFHVIQGRMYAWLDIYQKNYVDYGL